MPEETGCYECGTPLVPFCPTCNPTDFKAQVMLKTLAGMVIQLNVVTPVGLAAKHFARECEAYLADHPLYSQLCEYVRANPPK